MRSISSSRATFSVLFALALAACSGGGATIGPNGSGGPHPVGSVAPSSPATGATSQASGAPSPSPGASSTAAAAACGTANPGVPTGYDLPCGATTSEQTYGLNCSPAFVTSAGGYSSCNMKWIEHIDLPGGGVTIGGKWVASNNTFYLTNWNTGVYAYDTTNPAAPTFDSNLPVSIGSVSNTALVSAVENEETATNGKVLILSSTQFNDALVLDVSNPKAMKVIATIPNGPGHTQTCLYDCLFDYGSSPGLNQGKGILTQPTIIDLTNPSSPVLEPTSWNANLDPSIYYHNVTEVRNGLVATASNPVYFIDTTNPAAPKEVFALPSSTPEPVPGTSEVVTHYGHVGHSVRWPSNGNDKFFLGQAEGPFVGLCSVFPADGRTLYAYDTTNYQTTHNFTMVGSYTQVDGDNDEGANGGIQEVDSNGSPSTAVVGTPEGCSAHWFDVHPNFSNGGLLAMSGFAFGVRLLNVTSAGQVQQVGWWVPSGAADTVGVYWVGQRYLYALDFETGGIDVLEYTGALPAAGPLDHLRLSDTRPHRAGGVSSRR